MVVKSVEGAIVEATAEDLAFLAPTGQAVNAGATLGLTSAELHIKQNTQSPDLKASHLRTKATLALSAPQEVIIVQICMYTCSNS